MEADVTEGDALSLLVLAAAIAGASDPGLWIAAFEFGGAAAAAYAGVIGYAWVRRRGRSR